MLEVRLRYFGTILHWLENGKTGKLHIDGWLRIWPIWFSQHSRLLSKMTGVELQTRNQTMTNYLHIFFKVLYKDFLDLDRKFYSAKRNSSKTIMNMDFNFEGSILQGVE